jgi:hypothetical protein
MTKAEQCRAKAAEYAQLALQTTNRETRKTYQDLARHWREVAERLELPARLAALKGKKA